MKTYSPRERLEALVALDDNDGDVVKTAQETGVSLSTLYRWARVENEDDWHSPEAKFVSSAHAAKMLDCSVRTIRSLASKGVLTKIYLDTLVRFSVDEIESFDKGIKQRRSNADVEPEKPEPEAVPDADKYWLQFTREECPARMWFGLVSMFDVKTLGELAYMTPAFMRIWRNIGAKTVRDTSNYLSAYGLSLSTKLDEYPDEYRKYLESTKVFRSINKFEKRVNAEA